MGRTNSLHLRAEITVGTYIKILFFGFILDHDKKQTYSKS